MLPPWAVTIDSQMASPRPMPRLASGPMQRIPFKADHHNITQELLTYTEDLLGFGLTNKQISELTGLGEHTVKNIDKYL